MYTVVALEPAYTTLGPLIDARDWWFRVQEMRLIAALVEAGWAIAVDETQLSALAPARPHQPYRTVQVAEGTMAPEHITVAVDHAKPWIQIGSLGNPLFFPQWLAQLGQPNRSRDLLISFRGNLSDDRLVACLGLVATYADSPLARDVARSLQNRVLAEQGPAIASFAHHYLTLVSANTPLSLVSSQIGRQRAGKVFDPEYWDSLSRSEFVFCPGGDHPWSYRFYETMLARAYPIVERDGLAFAQGFFYLTLGATLPSRESLAPAIEANWRRAFELLCQKRALSRLKDEYNIS